MPKFGLLAGEGKIGLFKSLRGLRGSELRYAVGYNMSTLRMLGVPLAGLVSLPYDIQQGLNTIKRASQIVTQQSLKPGIQRAGVLGYARNIVPKARSLVPRTNVGIIDRYSSVYFGQASRRAIQMINSGQGRKAAFKAMFNPEVIDREIKRQGLAPRHDNVLYKWQLGTYMRAITGAPDPVLNNPYMQAKQYLDEHKTTDGFKLDARFGIADSKGQHLMMSNARFAQTLGEAGGMTPFAAESHVQNAMNAYMDDYMMSALDKDTAYIRKYNNLVQKNADLDRRKALVQTYRAMGMDKGLEGGNTYNLSMQLGDRGLNMERDDSGELIGYSTKFSSGEVSGAGKDLVSYRMKNDSLIDLIDEFNLKTIYGEFNLNTFKQKNNDQIHLALSKGNWLKDEPVLCRVNSFGSINNSIDDLVINEDPIIKKITKKINKEGKGVIVFVNQDSEAKPILNNINHLKTLQKSGKDFKPYKKMDAKDFGIGAQILHKLNVSKIRLLTTKDRKIKRVGMAGYGLKITETVNF